MAGIIQEGGLIGGNFLPEKEFIDVITTALNNEMFQKNFVTLINTIIQNIQAKNITLAYNNIEKLQKEILYNPPVSLMIITNLKDLENNNFQWYWSDSEKNTFSTDSLLGFIKVTSDELKKYLLEQKNTLLLSNHLSNMIKYVETTKMTNEDYDNLFHGNYVFYGETKGMGERANNQKIHGKTLDYIFYGDAAQDKKRGMIADGFLNHLGNMHKEFFDSSFNSVSSIIHDVNIEEGLNFYQILINSKNNVGWYTGGDLILLSGNTIIANIQLKTLQGIKGNISPLSTKKLLDNLLEIQEVFNGGATKILNVDLADRQKIARRFYKAFKTSAVMHNVEKQLEFSLDKFLKENLKLNF